jgi:hypothetical protein
VVACTACFADRHLVDWIRKNGKAGVCSWCKGRRARIVPLEKLGPLFREVVACYAQAEDEALDEVEPISVLLQEDWRIFSERIEADPEKMQQLAVAILKAGIDPKETECCYSDPFVRQSKLDLSIRDLFFAGLDPIEGPVPEDLEPVPSSVELALGDLGRSYPCNRVFYRARVYEDGRKEPYKPDELGAPKPEHVKKPGRGNRAGEPVLYVTTHRATALAEVRAKPGDSVGVACIKLLKPQRVLDLVHLPYLKTPFFQEDLCWKGEAVELLDTFGEELAKPVSDEDTAEQYEISQEACDAIRSAGYDGVAYPSGRETGTERPGRHNVFFFDPAVGRVTLRQIVRVLNEQLEFEVTDTP